MPQLTRALALILLLAACQTAPPPVATFRTLSVPMYSNATFDMRRLPGTWTQAAGFATTPARCPGPTGARVTADGTLHYRLCLNGALVQGSGTIAPTGPGRFRIAGSEPSGVGADWWVVWVDTGYRTLAIGTPSGAFGFILNRDGPLPPDRLAAAAEIFDFNGYDAGRLVPYR